MTHDKSHALDNGDNHSLGALTSDRVPLAKTGASPLVDSNIEVDTTTKKITLYDSSGNPYVVFESGRNQEHQGAAVAAAGDLTLGLGGNVFTVTGVATINAITTAGWRDGTEVVLHFTDAATVAHNTAGGAGTAVIKLDGAVAILAANGFILVLRKISGVWKETSHAFTGA